MKKDSKKKLSLATETVRALDADQLVLAAGGLMPTIGKSICGITGCFTQGGVNPTMCFPTMACL
jgi:hypothetical protein